MSEEVNNLEIDNLPQITNFKLNTLIFCPSNNETERQQGSNQQILWNIPSIDVAICQQQQDSLNNPSTQNTNNAYNSKVEDTSSEMLLSPHNKTKYSSENEKTADNCLITEEGDNMNLINQTNQMNLNKTESKKVNQNTYKEDLYIDIKNICEKIDNSRKGGTYTNQNSQNKFQTQNKYNSDSEIEKKQNFSDGNLSENLNRNEQAIINNVQSESTSNDASDVKHLVNKMLIKQDDQRFEELDDHKYSPCLTYNKKSLFHIESSHDPHRGFFFSDQDNNQSIKIFHNFQEYQKFNQCQSKPESPNFQQNQHQQFFRSKSLYNSQSMSSLKFLKVKNAIITIQRLARNPTTQINSINQLENDLKSYKASSFSKKPNQSILTDNIKSSDKTHQINDESAITQQYKDAFNGLRRREKLSLLCERGAEEDVKEIKQMIESDPKKYLRDPKDPQHMLNFKDLKGQTPLYIACKNGNLEVVKLLIAAQCNFLLMSVISKNLSETPFEAAIRWNHIQICSFMLEKCNFEDKYLISCLHLSQNKQLRQLIESKIQKKSTACVIF